MVAVVFAIILAQTSPLSCEPTDTECIEASVNEAIRFIDDAKLKEQRERNAKLPACPMWVDDYDNVECV